MDGETEMLARLAVWLLLIGVLLFVSVRAFLVSRLPSLYLICGGLMLKAVRLIVLYLNRDLADVKRVFMAEGERVQDLMNWMMWIGLAGSILLYGGLLWLMIDLRKLYSVRDGKRLGDSNGSVL